MRASVCSGALTALNFEAHAGGSEALKSALERLRSGSYTIIPRRRLLISIRPVGGSEYLLPRLALNDVFVSERNSGRVFACEMAGNQVRRHARARRADARASA